MTKTPVPPHSSSSPSIVSEEVREKFGPPEATNSATLTDGRSAGDFQSAYSKLAWLQIGVELFYLVMTLLACLAILVWLARCVILANADPIFIAFFGSVNSNQLVVWMAAGLAGACGGASSALKWLYHSVAKKHWHRDRLIWRIVVPPLSAVLSVFTGLMVVSGLIPFFSDTPFSSPIAGAAFGFFVGFFSDNLLAALQKLAYRTFGTFSHD